MDEAGFDPARVLGLLRRRLGVIVLTLGVVLAIACAAILILKPVYSASTLVYVDTGAQDLLDPEASITSSASENARIDSEVEILSSDATLAGVIAALSLEGDPQFAARPSWRDRILGGADPLLDTAMAQRAVLANFRSAISVERRGLTYLIAITARSGRPDRAAELANAVATTYLDAQLRAKVDTLANASAVLEARIGEAANALLDQYQGIAADLGTGADAVSDQIARARSLVLAEPAPGTLMSALVGIEETVRGARATRIVDPTTAQQPAPSSVRGWPQFEALVERAENLAVQADLQVPDSRIVSPALPPSEPSAPNWRLILVLGAFGGLAAGLALALIQEHFLGGFTSFAQLNALLGTSVLGDTPRLKISDTEPAGSPSRTITAKPLSSYAEAVRQIRAGADQLVKTRQHSGDRETAGGAVIMVTSAQPQEGKTSLALSLARTYALAGVGTVIIDCDLRRPALHRHLGTEPVTGLYDYLSGEIAPEALGQIIDRDGESGLSVITGARQSHVPTDHLVTSAAFGKLVVAAADHFEVVILDTPPLGPVVDGLYLARHADLAILAVKWASTAQADVRAAATRLENALPDHASLASVLTQSVVRSKTQQFYQSYYARQ